MMSDENGILSIDFLAGFTIFMLAFIWVVTMIPGLMIGLQSYTIDYDAVAYRTGVILVEDPGWPVSPPWESYIDQQKSDVTRFGLALSKDTPNILSEDKVNRFFCATAFIYPNDYRSRVIFGDYPYGFNISLIDDGGKIKSVGDVLPEGYGYIRRTVKIKGTSNATINQSYIQNHSFTKSDNATTHVFSILIDNPKLLGDITDPAYQIDPAREQITINITDLRSTITNYPPIINNTTSTVTLRNIKVFKQDGGVYSNVPLPATDFPYIDGSSSRVTAMPVSVTDNITLRFSPQFFDRLKAQSSKIYIALGFTVNPESTFLNNTQALPDYNTLDGQLTFNNPNTTPFYYDYNPANVTQPYLRDAVVEVAVWSGAVTSYGGVGTTPINGTHTIYASAGSGGTISPIGSVSVSDGANQLFTITNNTHYHITNVVVDGVSNGTIPSYTFTNVNQDHTIAASFAIDTYNITASAGVGGTITPSGEVPVAYGANQPFTIIPNAGFSITDVLVDGVSNGTISSYTFTNVVANGHTISATFALGSPPGTPVAAFTGTPLTGVAPLDVTFTDSSTGTSITNRRWDFGDGNISNYAVSTNPVHRYTSAGTYTVNLTVTNASGSNSLLRTNYIIVYSIQTFTASTTWTVPAGVTSVEFLVVAGGGGGGRGGAGGGAGGFRTGTLTGLSGSQTVTVGGGGAGGVSGTGLNTQGKSGSDSVFATITATGGGGGGGRNNALSYIGLPGGSGGGATITGTIGAGNSPSVTPSQGNNGGLGLGTLGGGGGGANVTGANAIGTTAGNGGAGAASSITGGSITYAGGGGGGGAPTGSTAGLGGIGGGGNGAVNTAGGSNGIANRGGGGGGGGEGSGDGGAGGSGIVIIRYY